MAFIQVSEILEFTQMLVCYNSNPQMYHRDAVNQENIGGLILPTVLMTRIVLLCPRDMGKHSTGIVRMGKPTNQPAKRGMVF